MEIPAVSFKRLQRFDQAGTLVRRQIDLRHVAGHYAFGMRTHSRQQHEHLFRGRVLRFIENDEGVAQGAAAHVRERRDLDDLPRDQSLDLFRIKHVAQCIVKRTQIRRDLFLKIAGQKSERFAGFHRRPGQK